MPYFIWLLGIVVLHEVFADPCYIAVNSSKAYHRLGGVIQVQFQRECALACSCATGHVNDECSKFGSTLPAASCLAYSFDFDSLQCALLGQTRPNMCAEPVTIYEHQICPTEYPKCGSTTRDEKIICDSRGYSCPAGYLPYYYYATLNDRFSMGGSLIRYEINGPCLDSAALPFNPPPEGVQNVTCHPATLPKYSACNGYTVNTVPRLGNALMLNDRFGCLPGFRFRSVDTNSDTFHTKPVCTVSGWLEEEGGAPITDPIITASCEKIV